MFADNRPLSFLRPIKSPMSFLLKTKPCLVSVTPQTRVSSPTRFAVTLLAFSEVFSPVTLAIRVSKITESNILQAKSRETKLKPSPSRKIPFLSKTKLITSHIP